MKPHVLSPHNENQKISGNFQYNTNPHKKLK